MVNLKWKDVSDGDKPIIDSYILLYDFEYGYISVLYDGNDCWMVSGRSYAHFCEFNEMNYWVQLTDHPTRNEYTKYIKENMGIL